MRQSRGPPDWWSLFLCALSWRGRGRNLKDADAIVLGAGGAGLMCAAVAGQRGRRVVLLDHADRPGKKILISGGGRCNFTNIETSPDRYLSENPHFAKSALGRYQAQDFIDLVERHGIAWHEKTLGQLFCDQSARQIVDMLLAECALGDVELKLGQKITDIDHSGGQYRVTFGDEVLQAPALVIATGGPSIPKMGATAFAYEVAARFGMQIVDPRPALVPLTLGPEDALFQSLSGVSKKVIARCGRAAFREASLFTHKGLSGPAILQISSYWTPGDAVTIDFLPDAADGWLVAEKRAKPRSHLQTVLGAVMPDRLASALSERVGFSSELANIPDKALTAAAERLANWTFLPTGTEGFAKAEVTAGGVCTSGLSSRTMASETVAGLYFIGEAVDVTGWLGGYNFQWAWASGWAAGQAL